MFGFLRRKKRQTDEGTAATFVEATGGGWFDSPDVVAADGGSQKEFVNATLQKARDYANEHSIAAGEQFEFTITDIPAGISGPHEIMFGLMFSADKYGLVCDSVMDETATFTRIE